MNRRRSICCVVAIIVTSIIATGCVRQEGEDNHMGQSAKRATFSISPTWEVEGSDPREAAHGIDIIVSGDELAVIWAAQNGPSVDGDWTHDIQRALVDPNAPDLNDATVETLVGVDGAQEPASSSVSGDASITTWEDDSGEVLSQRFMLYRGGKALWDEPRSAFEGGHSGHASSSSSWHAIALSEGWTTGGGVDNLGSGNEVYLTTMDFDGNNERAVKVDDGRAWWPLTASSADTTAVLWQKLAPDAQSASLKFAVFAPGERGDFAPLVEVEIAPDIAYYEYDVAYLRETNSYLVVGNSGEGSTSNAGFAVLFDAKGQELARKVGVPAFVRESKPAIDKSDGSVRVTYPIAPSGFQEFLIDRDSIFSPYEIELGETIDDEFVWPTSGTAAAVTGDGQRYFVAFRENGIEQLYLD